MVIRPSLLASSNAPRSALDRSSIVLRIATIPCFSTLPRSSSSLATISRSPTPSLTDRALTTCRRSIPWPEAGCTNVRRWMSSMPNREDEMDRELKNSHLDTSRSTALFRFKVDFRRALDAQRVQEAYELFVLLMKRRPSVIGTDDVLRLASLFRDRRRPGTLSQMVQIPRAMRIAGIRVPTLVWGNLLEEASKSTNLKISEDIFDQIQKEVTPNEHAYSSLMTVYIRHGKFAEAEALFRRAMAPDGTNRDMYTKSRTTVPHRLYKTAFNLYSDWPGHLPQCEALFEQYLRRVGKITKEAQFVLDAYSHIVAAYINANEYTKLSNVLTAIANRGLRPGYAIYSRMLNLYIRDNQTDLVLQTWRYIANLAQETRVGADGIKTVRYLLEGVRDLRVLEKGTSPEVDSYVRPGWTPKVPEALEVLELYKRLASTIANLPYGPYIRAIRFFSDQGEVHEAQAIFDGVHAPLLRFTREPLIRELIRGYAISGHYDAAVELTRKMFEERTRFAHFVKDEPWTQKVLKHGNISSECAFVKDDIATVDEVMRLWEEDDIKSPDQAAKLSESKAGPTGSGSETNMSDQGAAGIPSSQDTSKSGPKENKSPQVRKAAENIAVSAASEVTVSNGVETERQNSTTEVEPSQMSSQPVGDFVQVDARSENNRSITSGYSSERTTTNNGSGETVSEDAAVIANSKVITSGEDSQRADSNGVESPDQDSQNQAEVGSNLEETPLAAEASRG